MIHLYALAEENNVSVQIVGKADFQDSETMKNYCCSVLKGREKIAIDLEKCPSMDSTFMGMITKICFLAIQSSVLVEVNHANSHCKSLLTQLGIDRLFRFTDTNIDFRGKKEIKVQSLKLDDMRKNVIDSHERLLEVNKGNENKFKNLIEELKREDEDGKK